MIDGDYSRETNLPIHRYYPSNEALVVAVCLVGLLFYSHPPLVAYVDGTRVFRPDWLLALPLVAYVAFVRREIVLTRSGQTALVFLAVGAVSGVVSGLPAPFDFLTILLQLAFAVGLFVGLISLGLDQEDFRFLMRFWVILLLAASAFGLYQVVTLNLGLPLLDPYFGQVPFSFETMGYERPPSFFSEPSFYASALLTGCAVLVPCVAAGRPLLFSRRGQELALLVLVLALVTSGSIAGIVTAGLSTVFFLLFPDTRRFVLHILSVAVPIALLGAFAGTVLGISLVTAVLERLSRGVQILLGPIPPGGGSIHVRYGRWLAGLEAWRHYPFFGTGLGQYATWASEQYFPSIRRWLLSPKPLDKIHGAWIQVLGSTGLAGIIAFAGTWLSVIRTHLGAIAEMTDGRRTLCVAALSLTVVQLIDWMFGFGFIHPFRWILIGVAASFVTGVNGGLRREETGMDRL